MSAAEEKERIPGMERRHIGLMLALTASYLVFELAFSARLLDVMGSSISREELDRIESMGRLLSGTAIFLFVFGTFIFPALNRKRAEFATKVVIFHVAALALVPAAYYCQKAFVDHLVNRSGPEERKRAVHLRLVQSSVLGGQAELSGIELTREDLGTPEGKTFIALLPFYGSGLSRTDILDKNAVDALLRSKIREELGTRGSS